MKSKTGRAALAALLAVPSPWVPSGTAMAAGTVAVSVNTGVNRRAVSPYVYGANGVPFTSGGQQRLANQPLARYGGNRSTGYNWENNASNAGTDYGPNESDDFACWSMNCPSANHDKAGEAIRMEVDQSFTAGAAALVTVPIAGYVAADKNGNVTQPVTSDPSRWKASRARKGSALSLTPDPNDAFVNQDEFVNWLETAYAGAEAAGKQVFYSLDNEPGLWPYTHPMLHPAATRYDEMAQRTVDYGSMVKDRNPNALVFGGVCYGFAEYLNLQNAPDAGGRDYLSFILGSWKSAEQAQSRRVVDVLDLHWYPEATDGSTRITDNSSTPPQSLIDARLQAPRSLWDPSYVENSWIAGGNPINLLGQLNQRISSNYPGTKLAFTEYNYGGSEDVTGGLAEADVLGVFGREGVFAATMWPLWGDDTSFIYGGMDLYLNYDQAGSKVGDTSVSAQVASADVPKVSAYALAASADDSKVWVVLVNKTGGTLTSDVTVTHGKTLTGGTAYRLTSAGRRPQAAGSVSVSGNRFTYDMPAYSATTVALTASGGSGSLPPAQPQNFSAQVTAPDRVTLSWDPVDGAAGYKVQRVAGGGGFSQIGAPAGTSFVDTVAPGTSYQYQVRASNAFGDSTFAGPVTVNVPAGGGGTSGSGLPGLNLPVSLLSPGKRDGRNDSVSFANAAEVRILDARGRLVAEPSGGSWDGRDKGGRLMTQGLYIARIKKRDGSTSYEKVLLAR